MLVKILDAPDALIEQLKPETGERTASKAILVAAQRYPGLVNQVKRLQRENAQLRERLEHHSMTMRTLDELCQRVSLIAGQKDLFDDNLDLPEGH